MKVSWKAQYGSQAQFLSCPIYECLYEGTRGPGKTDALLMDFAQHCGKGFGGNWRGVLFRQTYPQLADVVAKSKRWFYQIYPGIRFNASDYVWTWPTGEQLLLRHMRVEDDYWNYHGHEYPWIGFEEITNWPSPACYESMHSCSRSAFEGMPRKFRATCNPYGVGHNWVKARFIDPAPAGVVIKGTNNLNRVRIHGSVYENKILMAADPDYISKLESITDENKRKAWLEGSWDIVAGGMFDDVWRESVHAIRPFEIPATWRIDRSFDWGSSRPFSVGWWAESDGTNLPDGKSYPRGTLFRIAEWYGWNGKPNEGCRMLASEIAHGILKKEKEMKLVGRVRSGPADSAIFDTQNGVCIADDMARIGVRWERADKGPGSRKNGFEHLRKIMKSSLDCPMEDPGFFVFDTCRNFIRTVPTLPRSEKDPDDVDTDAEDHIVDETRYRSNTRSRKAEISEFYL